jgi:sodium/bile acid cotransporter 7
MATNTPKDSSPGTPESNSPSPSLHFPKELPKRKGFELSLSDSSTMQSSSEKLDNAKHRWAKNIGLFIADQWFLVVLGILIIISSQVQVPASQQSVKTEAVTYLCVAIIFLITGCTLPTQTLIDNYSKWKIHLFVSSCLSAEQFSSALMPHRCRYNVFCSLLLLCSVSSAPQRQTRALWIPGYSLASYSLGTFNRICNRSDIADKITHSSVPTAISSNVVMTRKADGNTALTVVESTIGNFLGPFITPLLVQM